MKCGTSNGYSLRKHLFNKKSVPHGLKVQSRKELSLPVEVNCSQSSSITLKVVGTLE
jgi:hypothetical protein